MRFWKKVKHHLAQPGRRPALLLAAAALAGICAVTGGVALATRNASSSFADAAFSKLGSPEEVLNTLADRVVDRLTGEGGSFAATQDALVSELAGMADEKFGDINADDLINSVKGDVVAAGLGKLDGINVDAIVGQVTAALIKTANSELDKIDLGKLANEVIKGLAKDIDLEKVVSQQLAKVDIEKLIGDVVTKQLTSGGLLGMLFNQR